MRKNIKFYTKKWCFWYVESSSRQPDTEKWCFYHVSKSGAIELFLKDKFPMSFKSLYWELKDDKNVTLHSSIGNNIWTFSIEKIY